MKVSKKKKHKKIKRKIQRRDNNNIPTFVYVLQSTMNSQKNYIGVTNNLQRRILQHNGFKTGGARYTKAHRPWKFYAIFEMKNRHDALSLEWKAKHRHSKCDGSGLSGKIERIRRIGKMYVICKQHM